jgi:hypothetical protein
MGAQVLDIRPDGIVERLHDGNVITVVQEVGAVMHECADLRAENDRFRGFRKPEEFRHVASIPFAAVEIAKGQGMDILHDPDAMRRWLNDPANAAFRAGTGRV